LHAGLRPTEIAARLECQLQNRGNPSRESDAQTRFAQHRASLTGFAFEQGLGPNRPLTREKIPLICAYDPRQLDKRLLFYFHHSAANHSPRFKRQFGLESLGNYFVLVILEIAGGLLSDPSLSAGGDWVYLLGLALSMLVMIGLAAAFFYLNAWLVWGSGKMLAGRAKFDGVLAQGFGAWLRWSFLRS
jgi:hypothetical protein